MLKKRLSITILLIFMGWLMTTWYFGHQAEKQLNTLQSTPNYLHVLHYEKGFQTSQLRFKLTTNTGSNALNKQLHNIIFNADISHGPFVYTQHGIKIASTYWQINVEQPSLSVNLQHAIKKLFPNKNPFTLNIVFNFNAQGHYQLHIPQTMLSEFDQQLGYIAPSHFSGVLNLAQKTGNIEGKIGEITIKNNNGHLHIPATEVYADTENDVTSNLKRKANLRTEKITYQSDQLSNDIYFHLNLHIKQQLKNNSRHSSFELNINDAITPKQMINAVNVKLDYREPMNSLLQNQHTHHKQSIIHTLLQHLEQNQSSLAFSFNITGKKGTINLRAQASPNSIKKNKQLNAQVSLSADRSYIDSTPFTLLFAPYIKRNAILTNGKKYQFNASINGNKAVLNGHELLEEIATE